MSIYAHDAHCNTIHDGPDPCPPAITAMTHDYRARYWGHDYSVLAVSGHNIRISGWGSGIRPGDHLILPNGDGSTRYRVTAIEYKQDPPDMWFADATFDPR